MYNYYIEWEKEMPFFDVTIRVRVESCNDREAEDFVMGQAQMLGADSVFLVDSEEVDDNE